MQASKAMDFKTIIGLGLPVVDIITENGEMPTCDIVAHPEGCVGQGITNINKVRGRLRIHINDRILYDSGDYLKDSTGITIRVRGNTSAAQDKKPYKIKLQKKADLLLRGDDEKYSDKEWVLIKDSPVTINTVIGLKINELMQMQWTPAYQFVNLMLNGDYRGIYLLIESVKRNNRCRLNVDKQTGYIIEYDPYWWNEEFYLETCFTELPVAKFTFKEPDPITDELINSLKNTLDNLEITLFTNGYQEYIDIDSFASWLLAQDILGNSDGHGSNVIMTKYDDNPQSKIKMANLWDFDAIMKTPGMFSNSRFALYFFVLMVHPDQIFANAYREKWKSIGPTLVQEMKSCLSEFETSEIGRALDRSIPYDSERWNRKGDSLEELIDDAINWFEARKIWLDNNILTEEFTSFKGTYNLKGIKLTSPAKGVFIQNGKKWFVKHWAQSRM